MNFNEFEKKLDLKNISFLLTKKEEGPKWTIEKTKKIEKHYKEFLYLSLLYPNKVIVPTKEVDEYWHNHIMDTEKYIRDCTNLLGGIFHHYPYLGTKGKKDKKILQELFAETLELYKTTFGHSPAKLDNSLSACGGGGGSCGGGNCRGIRTNLNNKKLT